MRLPGRGLAAFREALAAATSIFPRTILYAMCEGRPSLSMTGLQDGGGRTMDLADPHQRRGITQARIHVPMF